jgi:hypothetical protein
MAAGDAVVAGAVGLVPNKALLTCPDSRRHVKGAGLPRVS